AFSDKRGLDAILEASGGRDIIPRSGHNSEVHNVTPVRHTRLTNASFASLAARCSRPPIRHAGGRLAVAAAPVQSGTAATRGGDRSGRTCISHAGKEGAGG